jgi:hypothetical protein
LHTRIADCKAVMCRVRPRVATGIQSTDRTGERLEIPGVPERVVDLEEGGVCRMSGWEPMESWLGVAGKDRKRRNGPNGRKQFYSNHTGPS